MILKASAVVTKTHSEDDDDGIYIPNHIQVSFLPDYLPCSYHPLWQEVFKGANVGSIIETSMKSSGGVNVEFGESI